MDRGRRQRFRLLRPDGQPMPPSPLPSPPPTPGGEHRRSFPIFPPDGETIRAEGRHGELLTDVGGATRPVGDVYREVPSCVGRHALVSPPPPLMCRFARRHRYAPTPAADDSDLRHAEEDQQTATPNPQAQRREDGEQNVLASKELFDTTKLDESITKASSLQQPTLPLKEELLTPQLLQALDKARPSFDQILPPISARKPAGWNRQFFIRVDLAGAVHTYPVLGGPFRNLEDAEKAILRHLDEQRDPKMCKDDGLSRSEIAVRDALYWPDGTRKKSSRFSLDHIHIGLLIQALLDKYNEENNLLGDLAYQVEDVVSFGDIYEGDCFLMYYHLNFTIKTKGGAGGIDNLLFAEVLRRISRGQAEEFELHCLHMLKPADNGPCYRCSKDDGGMKHPSDAGKYKGGHDSSYQRCTGINLLLDFPGLKMDDPLIFPKDMTARLEAEEARIRYIYGVPDVAKSDHAGLDKIQGRRVNNVVLARHQMDNPLIFPKSMTARLEAEKARILQYIYGGPDVANSDHAGLDKIQGQRVNYVVPARRQMGDSLIFPKDMTARLEAEEARILSYLYGGPDVAKSDHASLDKIQEQRVNYVVPARRQVV